MHQRDRRSLRTQGRTAACLSPSTNFHLGEVNTREPQGRGGSGYGNAVCNSCTPLRRGARRHESAGVLEPKLGYSVCRTSEKGGIAMAERHHADEGSKGGDRSILTFAIVAIALTVGLIVVGLRDKTVAPEAAQPTTEAPATPAPAAEAPATPAPAPSGSTP
jgi:hypothetical protein